MKIFPLQLKTYYSNAASKYGKNSKGFVNNYNVQLSDYASFGWRAYLPNVSNILFRGNSEIAPVKDDEFYSDTRRFSEYLHEKISKDLKAPTLEDVRKTVENVKKRTGADDKTVREVIARLVQFSSTSSLDYIGKQFAGDDVRGIYNDKQRFSTTRFMNYIAHEKKQIKAKGKSKKAIFIDSTFLDSYKNGNLISNELFECYPIKPIFYIMDGWNGEIDGKKVLYSIFARTGSLEDIAASVIKRMQEKGETFDDIFNKPILEKAKMIMGNDVQIKILQNPKVNDTSDESIRDLMMPVMPSVDEIESYINVMADGIDKSDVLKDPKFEGINIKALIAKFLDNMLVCYSPQKLNDELIEKHKEVVELANQKGYKEEDIRYVVPKPETKSFDLITYQYLLANGISEDRAIKIFDERGQNCDLIGDKKFYVILDDFSGSGESLSNAAKDIGRQTQEYKNVLIVRAPLVSTITSGGYFFCTEDEKDKHMLVEPETVLNKSTLFDKLSPSEQDMMRHLDNKGGYGGCGTCLVFPFSFPDNNSSMGQLFSAFFLNNSHVKREIPQCFSVDIGFKIIGKMFSTRNANS